MQLVDSILRRGHLSEQSLVETVMTGDRPAHIDRCDLCARRAVELGRWLDEVKVVGLEEADRAFPPERLALQHAQILRRLEQLDEPSRIIAFPSQYQLETRDMGRRRVSPAWVGVAAAAGLVLGVIGGQISARSGLTEANAVPPAATTSAAAAPAPAPATRTSSPTNASLRRSDSLLELDLDTVTVPSLDSLNEITPRLLLASNTRSGG